MVFTDLARKASQLKNHPLLAGWLHHSTRWAAAGLRRAEQRRIANEQAAALEPLAAGATEPPADWAQLAPLLDEALDSLNAKDRDAVLMRYFNDRPFAEIGTTLGLSENAARMRVERSLEKLRIALTQRGTTTTTAALGLSLVQNAVSAAPTGTASIVTAMSLGNAAATSASSFFAYFLMTKLQLTLAGAAAIALAIGLSMQTAKNHRLQDQLTNLQAQLETSRTVTSKIHDQVAQCDVTLKRLDDAIAAQTPPLTPEQQERVRLDTVIRKGELDYEYASLFRQLRLAPEPLDKLKTLIVERNQAIYDAIKLAKSQGLEPATPSEQNAIGESATTEIDQRIAGLIGIEHYTQFRDWITLQPYRMWAQGFAATALKLDPYDQEQRTTRKFDEHTEKFAQLLAEIAPGFLDQVYRANGWPVEMPAELKEGLSNVLPPDAMADLDYDEAEIASRRRMYEIAREAALQGKLKLSKSSARDYPVPNATSNTPAK
jgi:RNA polymerase sigma factor (sigma-70 family)